MCEVSGLLSFVGRKRVCFTRFWSKNYFFNLKLICQRFNADSDKKRRSLCHPSYKAFGPYDLMGLRFFDANRNTLAAGFVEGGCKLWMILDRLEKIVHIRGQGGDVVGGNGTARGNTRKN